MFYNKVDFKRQGNVTAFFPAGLKSVNSPGHTRYVVPALWMSPHTSTRGSLVIGEVIFTFSSKEFRDLSYAEVIQHGGKNVLRENPTHRYDLVKDIRSNAQALIGENSLWGGTERGMPERVAKLLKAYSELPEIPVNYDGWYKLVK